MFVFLAHDMRIMRYTYTTLTVSASSIVRAYSVICLEPGMAAIWPEGHFCVRKRGTSYCLLTYMTGRMSGLRTVDSSETMVDLHTSFDELENQKPRDVEVG